MDLGSHMVIQMSTHEDPVQGIVRLEKQTGIVEVKKLTFAPLDDWATEHYEQNSKGMMILLSFEE